MATYSERERQPVFGTLIGFALTLFQFVMAAIVVILLLAFVLYVLGVNTDVTFASWIYDRASGFMAPFNGSFDSLDLSNGIHLSLLVAAVIYGAIGAVIGELGRRVL